MGYQKHARRSGARSPKRAGVQTRNVLVLTIGFPPGDYGVRGYPDLFHGMESALAENGLNMMLASLSTEGPLPVGLNPERADGVLVFGRAGEISASAVAKLISIPTVCVMRGFDEYRGRLDRVLFDNAVVGPMAAKYLIDRKHRRIGFYSIDPSHPAMGTRQAGFTATASAAGIEAVSYVSEHSPEGLSQELAAHHELVERIAHDRQRVSGLFVPSAYWTAHAYQAFAAAGIVPGRDIEIVSCDNVPLFLDQLTPRPATIDINLELVGRRAVEQLLWRVANRNVKNAIDTTIEPVLVPGSQDRAAQ